MRRLRIVAVLVLAAACHRSPTAPSVVAAVETGSPSTPIPPVAVPLSPADGAHIPATQIPFWPGPVTLVTRNTTLPVPGNVVNAIEIASDPNFSSRNVLTFVPDAGGQTSMNTRQTFEMRTYYWRVRAAAGDVLGPQSQTLSFVIEPAAPSALLPPAPVEPVPDSVQPSRATFLINHPLYPAGTARVTYRFQLARDARFASILQQFDVPDAPYNASGGFTRVDVGRDTSWILPDGDVYWRVQSIDAATGAASGYTSVRHFTVGAMFIDPPTLIAPIQGARAPSYQPELTINMGKHSGRIYSVALEVDVADNRSFAFPLAYSTNRLVADIGIIRMPVFATLKPGLYYWRARSTLSVQDTTTLATNFTPTETFTVGPLVIQAPALVQPAAGAFTHARPTFVVKNAERSGVGGPLSYRFQVLVGSTVVGVATVPEDPGGQTSWTAGGDLTAGTSYTWNVSAIDPASGATSAGGETRSFQIVPLRGGFYILQIATPCRANGPTSFTFDAATLGDVTQPPVTVLTNGSLTLKITRANGSVSGTLGGSAHSSFYEVTVSSAQGATDPARVAGTAASDGRLSGTISGYVSATYFDYYLQCSDMGMTWSLVPR